jgi:PAP2 superfamily
LWWISSPSFSEVEPVRSLAVDAGLWAATSVVERFWYVPEGQNGFFSSGLDDGFRSSVHDSKNTPYYNATERRWRKFSDISIAGLVGVAVADPLIGASGTQSGFLIVSRSFALNNFVSTGLKYAVHRSRPKPSRYPELPQKNDAAFSFPSSHSSNAFVAASSWVLLNPETPLAHKFLAYGLASSVGLARVMADRHNLTDVVAGAVIGYSVTYLTVRAWQSPNFEMGAGPTSVMATWVF